jgi:hypothetical protein
MSVRECVIRGAVASEHIVQFFDSDESRAECVAGFLAEGFDAGETAIVVAKSRNWTAIVEQLEARKIDVKKQIAAGKLVVKDAPEMLRRLSRNGSPDATAFGSVVGTAVEALSRGGGRVRAYGEMVDILAQGGELADAIRLEALWNALGERVPFYLLCGYAAAHFVSSSTHRALRDICASHTGVHRHAHDPLATWLLNSAHNAAGAAAITH